MRSWMQHVLLILTTLVFLSFNASADGKNLRMYFIDVEGGQATLLVAPSGQSLLVDTGWPGENNRDADRIAAAVKDAGLKQIDYLLITHYHPDHVGGVPQLLKQVKVGTFVDHGPNTENDEMAPEGYDAYLKSVGSSKHIVAKPGDKIPVAGVNIEVLAAAGDHISKPVNGAGKPNPYCSSEPKWPADHTENAASLGFLLTYGSFRFLDFGDLTKDKEIGLVCPNNLIGTVDLFLVSHHGMNMSNTKAMVDALHPRVAIMENGPKKGDSPEAWQTVHDSPGLKDLWQLHYTASSGDHNVAKDYIANLDGDADGHSIKATAQADGTFTVLNTRNQKEETYKK
ncbi:MAG TPA: MBL fold metallo-hydrolase [Candidatus Sulfotelmatobacter sp.]|nr:MBL fold metallo-hydrolase [Candidatus Sulfotelmatobacter sp.]